MEKQCCCEVQHNHYELVRQKMPTYPQLDFTQSVKMTFMTNLCFNPSFCLWCTVTNNRYTSVASSASLALHMVLYRPDQLFAFSVSWCNSTRQVVLRYCFWSHSPGSVAASGISTTKIVFPVGLVAPGWALSHISSYLYNVFHPWLM